MCVCVCVCGVCVVCVCVCGVCVSVKVMLTIHHTAHGATIIQILMAIGYRISQINYRKSLHFSPIKEMPRCTRHTVGTLHDQTRGLKKMLRFYSELRAKGATFFRFRAQYCTFCSAYKQHTTFQTSLDKQKGRFYTNISLHPQHQ